MAKVAFLSLLISSISTPVKAGMLDWVSDIFNKPTTNSMVVAVSTAGALLATTLFCGWKWHTNHSTCKEIEAKKVIAEKAVNEQERASKKQFISYLQQNYEKKQAKKQQIQSEKEHTKTKKELEQANRQKEDAQKDLQQFKQKSEKELNQAKAMLDQAQAKEKQSAKVTALKLILAKSQHKQELMLRSKTFNMWRTKSVDWDKEIAALETTAKN